MVIVVKVMVQLDFGLEIRDRMWLKIIIFNVFIGWLYYMQYQIIYVFIDGMFMFLWNLEINNG